jgi:hypothetical protein
MRYINGFGVTIATEQSDLKYGEYRCTECNKVITREQVIPNDRGQSITVNSINFCSSKCRSENRNGYDDIIKTK